MAQYSLEDPFDGFNFDGRLAIARMRQEAMYHGHSTITIDHLLLGLVAKTNLDDGSILATSVLDNLDVDRELLYKRVSQSLERRYHLRAGKMHYQPKLFTLFQRAIGHAKKLGCKKAGSENLVAGILLMTESPVPLATRKLRREGLTRDNYSTYLEEHVLN